MRTAALVTCLLLAGCAATPTQVVETGQQSTYALKNAPEVAAGCMARNVEKHYEGNLQAIVRRLEKPESYEVVVRNFPEFTFVYAIAEPQKATVWVREQWFSGRDTIAATMTAGC